ncbi:MAG TPA: alpha/beta hydrolase [Steroidobacteraceae bacterium]|nr:alpha/beta hydrolase [Steroidobacteraceae bacterium]
MAIPRSTLAASALALTAALVAASCGSLAFTAANLPAHFGDFERRADLAYGSLERQTLDVYVPDGARDRPIIMFWYGGGWENGSKADYRFVGATLAKAGYVVVLPDYRLYPEVKFPAFVDDGAAALAWVAQHAREIGGDPQRLYLAGHSAGAHLAAMLAYDPARLERVGLRREVVRGFIGLSGPYALDPNSDILNAIFAAPYRLSDWQPAQLAAAGAPPALLLHGEDDTTVDVSHARRMAEKLQSVGVPVTLRTYPGRGHRDTVAAFAGLAPRKLPVLEEIRRFVGE